MKTKALTLIAVALFATVTLGTQFHVMVGPVVIDYGNVHEIQQGTGEFKWIWTVTDQKYDIVDTNGVVTANSLYAWFDSNEPYEIIHQHNYSDGNDPNIYLDVTIYAYFDRPGKKKPIKLKVKDGSDNVGEGEIDVTITDNKPPTFGGCRNGQ